MLPREFPLVSAWATGLDSTHASHSKRDAFARVSPSKAFALPPTPNGSQGLFPVGSYRSDPVLEFWYRCVKCGYMYTPQQFQALAQLQASHTGEKEADLIAAPERVP